MPITFYQDHASGVRYTRLLGGVTDAELLDAYARVLASAEFDPNLDVLVDVRALDPAGITRTGLSLAAAFVAEAAAELRTRPRVAVVAPTPRLRRLAEHFARAAVRQRAGIEYRVFVSDGAARAWLGLQ